MRRLSQPVSLMIGVQAICLAVGFWFQYQMTISTTEHDARQSARRRHRMQQAEQAPTCEAPVGPCAARSLLCRKSVYDKDVRAEFGREVIEAKRGQYLALYAGRLNEKAPPDGRA